MKLSLPLGSFFLGFDRVPICQHCFDAFYYNVTKHMGMTANELSHCGVHDLGHLETTTVDRNLHHQDSRHEKVAQLLGNM